MYERVAKWRLCIPTRERGNEELLGLPQAEIDALRAKRVI